MKVCTMAIQLRQGPLAGHARNLSDGLRRQNREQSQGQRRALLAAQASDQDRRPPRCTGWWARNVAGGRAFGHASARHEPASHADRPSDRCAPGQRARADGAASRRERCAPCPATGCATVGMACHVKRPARVPTNRQAVCGVGRPATAHVRRYAPSGAGGHSAGRSCIKIYISGVHKLAQTYSI